MLRKAALLVALFSVLGVSLNSPAMAQGEIVYQAGLGASAIWFDDEAKPSDVEASIHGSAAPSGHISAVAMAAFGFDHSYVRGSAGLRFRVSDAANPRLGMAIGIQRHMSSEPELRPEEFAADVSMGWKPWPQSPRVSLNGIATYGLDSNLATIALGVRYRFSRNYTEEPIQ